MSDTKYTALTKKFIALCIDSKTIPDSLAMISDNAKIVVISKNHSFAGKDAFGEWLYSLPHTIYDVLYNDIFCAGKSIMFDFELSSDVFSRRYISDILFSTKNGETKIIKLHISYAALGKNEEKAHEWDSLYKAIDKSDCSIAIYKIEKDLPQTIHINETLRRETGYISQPSSKINPLDFIHPDDAPAVREIAHNIQQNKSTCEFEHRILCKNNEYKWMRVFLTPYTISGETILFGIYTNCVEQNVLHSLISKDNYVLENIISKMPGVAMVYSISDTIKCVYASDGIRSVYGYDKNEYLQFFGNNCIMHVTTEDRDRVSLTIRTAAKNHQKFETEFRILRRSGTISWAKLVGNWIKTENSEEIYYGVAWDITSENNARSALLKTSEKLKSIMNSVPGGICTFKIDADNKPRELTLSDGFTKLLGYTPQEIKDSMNDANRDIIHPDDLKNYINSFSDFLKNPKKLLTINRFKHKNGKYIWVSLSGTGHIESNGDKHFFTVSMDVSDLKNNEQKLRTQNEVSRLLIEKNNDIVFEYHIEQDIMKLSYINDDNVRETHEIPHYAKNLLSSDRIHHDFRQLLKSRIEKAMHNTESGSFDYMSKYNTEDYFWYSMSYSSVADASGNPYIIVGKAKNIQKDKDMAVLYEQECATRKIIEKDLVAFCSLNLKKNTLVEYTDNIDGIKLDSAVIGKEVFEHIRNVTVTKFDTGRLSEFFNAKLQLQKYSSGKTKGYLEYRRRFADGDVRWVSMNYSLVEQPATQDIYMFMYIRDINTEKITQTAFQKMVENSYNFVGIINAIHGDFYYLTSDTKVFSSAKGKVMSYNQMINDTIVSSKDIFDDKAQYDAIVKNTALENILKILKDNTSFSFNASIKINGQSRIFRMSYQYIDDNKKYILFSQAELTESLREEKRQQDILNEALLAAKKANDAKADFLSRMSHDIRTPLNGIMGLTELMLDKPSLSEGEKESLVDIKNSGEYLLTLINDMLDSQKLAINKMELITSSSSVKELIQSVISSVRFFAKQKNINLVIADDGMYYGDVIMDSLRVQQVLTNILSNSVKFTHDGGTIQLILKTLKKNETTVWYEAIIRDNGIGISKDFLPNIFMPFEQEHSERTANYTGTGLGMSIVKKLVDLMGGTVEVDSVQGEGTEFRVFLCFELTKNKITAEGEDLHSPEINFTGKRVLLCEDHPINMKIAEKLLSNKGFIIDKAENGQICVERFIESDIDFYDYVLMDIRMPVMDGYTAAKEIRSANRSDAKTVPIIAMTANTNDADVKTAHNCGMNDVVGKPINIKKLYETLEENAKK